EPPGRAERLGAGSKPSDPELLGERLRVRGDVATQVCGLEDDRLASVREDLAEEPLLAADRCLGNRRTVREGTSISALDPPPGDRLRVPDPGVPDVAQPARLEPFSRLELVARQARAAHAVEPEAAFAVSRAVPRVDVPVRESPLEGIRLDEACRRRLLPLLQV